jgi:long-chain acyl-CoA synthetase
VLAPNKQATSEDLVAFCESRLAPYEVPRRIEFVEALPKTTVGKILRRELVQMEGAKKS